MSPTERAFFARVQRRVADLQPDVIRALLAGFRYLGANLSETQVAALIASGRLDAIITDALLQRAFLPVQEALRAGLAREVRYFRRDLPRKVPPLPTVGIGFDILNPRVLDAIRTMETRVMTTLAENVRGAVRAHVEAGLAEGVGPRTIARGLRGVLDLAPNQVGYIANLRRELETGQYATAARRVLIDQRFNLAKLDALTGAERAARIDRIVEAYRRSYVTFNAETISRTAALDAQKLGQRLSWQDAIDKGYVDGGNLVKQWIGVMDDRERDLHVAMEGVTVPFDDPYILPDGTAEMEPGEGEYNCRCLSRVYIATPDEYTALAAA